MKLLPVVIVIGFLFVAASGGVRLGHNDFASAAASGDWNSFQKLIQKRFKLEQRRMDENFQSMRKRMDEKLQSMRQRLSQAAKSIPDFESIKNLQPQGPDSNVYGEAQYSYHSSSTINGQKTEQRGGRRIVNRNGVIEEYDLS